VAESGHPAAAAYARPFDTANNRPIHTEMMEDELSMTVEIAVTDAQVEACFPAMLELRSHLERDTFVQIIREMQRDGYVLASLQVGHGVVAVAGFRIKRTLFCDKFLYVDDLATLAAQQSKGYGTVMLAWLKARASAEGCAELRLDSGLQRTDAHRFYERNGLVAAAYHFRVVCDPGAAGCGTQPGGATNHDA
jgi:GNAT superfamily N-acetyltransferase